MSKKTKFFCDVCRGDDDLDAKCEDCAKRFHSDCAISISSCRSRTIRDLKSDKFLCEVCLKDAQNDDECGKCGLGPEDDTGMKYDRLLLCDGCPKSYHLSCLGLKSEPDDDQWFCPECAEIKKGATETEEKSSENVTPVPTSSAEKQEFCEVCQGTGRLLVCDYCPKSFHPSCILQFFKPEDLVNEEDKWKCPICCGHNVLRKAEKHKYTLTQLKGRMSERNKENKRINSKLISSRNRFLKENFDLFKPFVSISFLKKLKSVTLSHPVPQTPQPIDFCKLKLAQDVIIKDFQMDAIRWLFHCYENITGAILADDMGLGKTFMTLAFISYLDGLGISGPFLIVVPLSTVGNWQREAGKFVPHLSIAKLCGSGQERRYALDDDEVWFGERNIYITTYETLISTENFFTQHCWQAIVLDEAHRIKGSANGLRAALDHIDGNFRLLLTGTPLQNNLQELYRLLTFLFPDVFPLKCDIFDDAIISDKNDNHIHNKKQLKSIKLLLSKILLRRKKEQVIDLPQKIQQLVWLPLSQSTSYWYYKMLDLKRILEEAEGVELGVKKLYGLLVKLRLVACHPRTLSNSKPLKELPPAMSDEIKAWTCNGLTHMESNNKLRFLDKLLCTLFIQNLRHFPVLGTRINIPPNQFDDGWTSIAQYVDSEAEEYYDKHMISIPSTSSSSTHSEGGLRKPHRVLIFSQFIMALDEIENYCKWRGFNYLRLDGSTSKVVRELDIREFNASDSLHFVYLISTRAGGLGINLTRANHVILYDQDWNPHVDNQAVDRAHRIGQDRTVFVYRLVQEWTIEERLLWRQQQKLKLEDAIIGDHSDMASNNKKATKSKHAKNELNEDDQDDDEESDEVYSDNANNSEADDEDARQSSTDMIFSKLTSSELKDFINFALHKHTTEDLPENFKLIETMQRKRNEFDWKKEKLKDDNDIQMSADSDENNTKEGSSEQTKKEQEEEVQARDNDEEDNMASPQSTSSDIKQQQDQSIDEFPSSDIIYERRVRQPTRFYQPEDLTSSARRRIDLQNLRHESHCFMCQDGGELIECSICPKVYHLDCQNLDEIPKGRWTCSWHECWDCYRKVNAAGGRLIHCLACPKSFCLDCFPINFRRTNPPPKYWEIMNRMGWNVSADKMITFICNDCRVVLEQKRRKEMKANEKLQQQNQMIEQNVQLRRHVASSLKPSSSSSSQVNAYVFEFLKLQEAVRHCIENLVPNELLFKFENNKLANMLQDTKMSDADLTKYLESVKPLELIAVANARGILVTGPMDKNDLIKMIVEKRTIQNSSAISQNGSTKKFNKLLISVCKNCRLPGHLTRSCPYPPEKIFVSSSGLENVPKHQVCPICKESKHMRIYCPKLDEMVHNEYKQRIQYYKTFIEKMKEAGSIILNEEDKSLDFAAMKNLVSLKIQTQVTEVLKSLPSQGIDVAHEVTELDGTEEMLETKSKTKVGKKVPKAQAPPKVNPRTIGTPQQTKMGGIQVNQFLLPVKKDGMPFMMFTCEKDLKNIRSSILANLNFSQNSIREKLDQGLALRASRFPPADVQQTIEKKSVPKKYIKSRNTNSPSENISSNRSNNVAGIKDSADTSSVPPPEKILRLD